MSDESPSNSPDVALLPMLRQARRDRWATTVASLAAVLHAVAGLVVFGWFYFIAPRYKFELAQMGRELSQGVILQINLSDLIVNYWYLFGVLFVPVPILSFVAHVWLARRLGLRWACVSTIAVAALIVSNAAVSHSILRYALPFGYGQGVDVDVNMN